jgi:hypothetical protein
MANKKSIIRLRTPIIWQASGGTAVFTPQNVANGAGRIGTSVGLQTTLGTTRTSLFEWRAVTKSGSTYTVGNMLQLFLATSDGTRQDGSLALTDGGVSSIDRTRNLRQIGAVIADITTASSVLAASGLVQITARYVSPVWWNALGVTLTNTAGDHVFVLTPITQEIE